MNTDKEKCVICTKSLRGTFDKNNPRPVRDAGNCCGECNWMVVLPARLATLGPTKAGSMIKTCSGEMGYHYGNYHYWWSPTQDRWIGVHTDVHGDADSTARFFGATQESILYTIGQFARLGVTG